MPRTTKILILCLLVALTSLASLAASGPPPHCIPCMPAQGSSEALRDKSPARCPSFPVEAQRRWSFFVNI